MATAPILLVGAFGHRNPGDEALLSAFHRALRDFPLVVASTDPADTLRRHGLRAVSSRSWPDVVRAVRRSAGVVFAGGTVFKELPPSSGRQRSALLRNSLAVATLAQAAGKPVCMVGVGVGSLRGGTSRALARRLARQADLLVLRDEASVHALAGIGAPMPVRMGADPAWTLLDQVPTDTEPREETVTVVPSRWATGPLLVDALVDALQSLMADGCRVQLQPWQCDGTRDDDRYCADVLARRLDGDVTMLSPPETIEDAAAVFGRTGVVVSARFHALVAAGAAGTSFLAIAHEHKLAAIAERLGQPVLPLSATPAEARAAAQAARAVTPPAHAAVRGEVAAAEEAFALLRLVLTGGQMSADSINGLRLEPAW